MISRARIQDRVHIFCKEKEYYVKYKSVNDVIQETELLEKNFSVLLPSFNNFIDIDDKAYRIMYYNFKFMDSILKTNTKAYLEDILINKGYNIDVNDIINIDLLNNKTENKLNIKDKILSLLNLDKNNLSEFEKDIASDDKLLEKHFNLRLFLKDIIDDKLIDSITSNLYIETIQNKYSKIRICKDIMNVLNIKDLQSLTKEITANFNTKINNIWLDDNIKIIKKLFNIRTNKYDSFDFYNIYLLLITILKNLFDTDLFIVKKLNINKIKYIYYVFNGEIFTKHLSLINKLNIDIFDDM
jgi:hypothetical protein